ncbi:MAG: type III-A CRISPR-associated protein Csm2 [Lachnospiraceae bacterium]|nr:type III-A CRISPR-associated protein Csm2 [Lachnospiraceae bacterium]
MKLDGTNYVDLAEKAILTIIKQDDENRQRKPRAKSLLVTTSKIRNLLAMTAELQTEVRNSKEDKLTRDMMERINYLKIRFVYEAGRDEAVRKLVETARIREHLDDVKNSKEQYIIFSMYIEALVAFRKFYGKNDD